MRLSLPARALWLAVLIALSLSPALARSRKPMNKKLVLGYYMPFGQGPDSPPFKTISQHKDSISAISPTWFLVKDADCSTDDKRDVTLSDFCAKNGMKVWPLIANGSFTYDAVHPLFADPEKRAKLVDRIVDLMSTCKGCQGINLDFEGINPADRGVYNEFLKAVSARLHAKGYLVTIDVPAETKDEPTRQWPGAFDYKEINKYCDYICIMTYDENIPGSDPGPVSSAPWVEQVLAYATKVIPKGKILLGLPFYGYDWAEDKSAFGFRYAEMLLTIEKYSITVQWDEASQCPWYSYTDADGKKRTAWFDNKRSMEAKLKLAKKYDIGGICVWSMGNEDPEVWSAIKNYQDGR
jgi:spore germination protein